MNTIQVYISKLYHLHKSISQTHAQKQANTQNILPIGLANKKV